MVETLTTSNTQFSGSPAANTAISNQVTFMSDQQQQQELVQLEQLCKRMYESHDALERNEAEKAMIQFSSSPDCLTKCRLLLEHSSLCYAQLLAATTLIKIISKQQTNNLSVEQRLEIRNFALNYLATRPNLAPFVVQALTKLYAKITKLSWFESKDSQQVIPQVDQYFFQVSPEHQVIGVQILSQVVQEINHLDGEALARSVTKQRRIASTFRDSYLNEIFSVSCSILQASLAQILANDRSPERMNLVEVALRLALNCLSYDFIGTTPDESNSDDLPTVQIPTSWRRLFLGDSTLDLFFNLYHTLPPPMAAISLSCLVQIASVRRSLFSNPERIQFLTRIITGVRRILENPSGLSDATTYHEFCRLLARFKANYQLTELTKVPGYPEMIALITNFTVTSLRMWQYAPNSIHYLLMLWQKLVSSACYCKQPTEPHLLDKYTPEVMKAYITYRLESVTAVVQNGVDDPLDDTPMLQQQLEQLATISRQAFEETGKFIISVFDQTAKSYQEKLLMPSSPPHIELSIQEGRLAWLVYIIGAAISSRMFFSPSEEYDSIDGDLACRVIQLMRLSDSQLAQGRRCEKLELAMLSFFESYRKCYVGDQQQRTTKMYKRLSEVLGLSEESRLLSVFVTKIITNLKYWSSSEVVIKNTLFILNELSVGYASLRRLIKLDEIQFMLNNHTSEHFPFLNNSIDVRAMKNRTIFYVSLGRILLQDVNEGTEDKFDDFMAPLTSAFEALRTVILLNPDPSITNNLEAKSAFIGVCRDLTGLSQGFTSQTTYVLLFEWIYPTYTPMIRRAIELWYHDPSVTTPALKLVAELVDDRHNRLQFGASSANGILLFKEVSSIIVSFGERFLSLTDIPEEDIYQRKLKGISIVFKILHSALRGYINFAIFALYGDSALNDLLQMFIKLFLSILNCDILTYTKLSLQYYPLMEVTTDNHCDFLLGLEPQIFGYLLKSIHAGLTSLDTRIPPSSFQSLNNIVTYLFKWLSKVPRKSCPSARAQHDEEKRQICLKALEVHSEEFHGMLATILNTTINEDPTGANSNLSKPFLGLILLNEDYFNQLRQSIINSQPPEKQKPMSIWFETLMDGIARNLTQKNRDRFSQNVLSFKREISEGLKKTFQDQSSDHYYYV